VLGTSVLEVGRDFDADWGLSSRARCVRLFSLPGVFSAIVSIVPERENLVILERNVRASRRKDGLLPTRF
jgi:CRISPR-associated endonuclease/helicase Cas3